MKINQIFPIETRVFKGDENHRWPEFCGIEFELENCTQIDGFGNWAPHADGSLRDGIEFVLYPPQGGKKLEVALDEFYDKKMKYTTGPRTSTHLHLNMSDSTLDVVRSMIILMYTVEDALFNVVGETRKWAGYAMPLSEMDPNRLRLMLTSTEEPVLRDKLSPNRNQERYYGFNVSSLRKHGTVEFRYFPGGPSKTEMADWLDFICAVKKAATSHEPGALIDMVNNEGDLVTLLINTFGADWAGRLMAAVPPDRMFEKFSEVSTLATVGDQMERRERLVFLTKPLVKFINGNLLQEAGRAELAKVVDVFPVLSEGDFMYYMGKALTADYQAGGKSKKVAREEDPFDGPEVVEWEQEPQRIDAAMPRGFAQIDPDRLAGAWQRFEARLDAHQGIPEPAAPQPFRAAQNVAPPPAPRGQRLRDAVNPVDYDAAMARGRADLERMQQEAQVRAAQQALNRLRNR